MLPVLHRAPLAAALACVAAVTPAFAQDAPAAGTGDVAAREEARDIAARAYERYEARDFGAALALFRAAHRRYPNARLLLGIGSCLVELERPVEAIDALESALEHPVAPLDERLRQQTRAMLDDVRPLVGRLELHVEPPGAVMLLDGEPLDARPGRGHRPGTFRLRLRAGVHRLEARARAHLTARREVTVEGSDGLTTLRLRLPPDPLAPDRRRVAREPRTGGGSSSPWPWIAVGAGAAVLTAAVVLIAVSASSGTPEGEPGSLGYVVEVLRHDR